MVCLYRVCVYYLHTILIVVLPFCSQVLSTSFYDPRCVSSAGGHTDGWDRQQESLTPTSGLCSRCDQKSKPFRSDRYGPARL